MQMMTVFIKEWLMCFFYKLASTQVESDPSPSTRSCFHDKNNIIYFYASC